MWYDLVGYLSREGGVICVSNVERGLGYMLEENLYNWLTSSFFKMTFLDLTVCCQRLS